MGDVAPAFEGGGGGLISTADDYLKFARAMLGGGAADGVRLVKPQTIAQMTANRLTPEQRQVPFMGMPFWMSQGFGLVMSMIMDPVIHAFMGAGSEGAFGWPGAFGTWWQADAQEDMILIYLIQDSMPLGPEAVTAMQNQLAVWATVQNAWYGLSLGSVLLLAAIGLAITFGVMGVINMAHGEMVMLGAYTTFVTQDIIRDNFPGLFDWSLLIALPLAFLVAAIVGIIIERGIIRHLYGRPLETLLATWGVSLILQQGVRSIFGPTNQEVGNPSWMSGSFQIGELDITWNRLWIIVFSLIVFFVLLVALNKTPLGLQMRAVTQNRRMASAMGIRTPFVDSMTFALGSGIAGIAGVALSQIDNVSPNLGQSYIIDSFMVVVFGGVGNLWGTLVGALSLGILNKFLEPFAGAVLGKILVLVLIILFIQKRPRGLFALKGRAVEA